MFFCLVWYLIVSIPDLCTLTYFVFVMPLCASAHLCLVVTSGKGLTSWLSFVVYNCEFVTFPLVSLVRCHT